MFFEASVYAKQEITSYKINGALWEKSPGIYSVLLGGLFLGDIII